MRIIIPSEYTKKLTSDAVVTRGLDNCLWLYSSEDWKKLIGRMNNLIKDNRHLARLSSIMCDGAAKVHISKDGKISIPNYLKEYAGIKKDIVFIGLKNQVELWAKEEFTKYKDCHGHEFKK
jgi:MraZ protein